VFLQKNLLWCPSWWESVLRDKITCLHFKVAVSGHQLGTNANIGKFKRADAKSAYAELISEDVTDNR